MLKKKFKKQKGFAATDALVAILIVSLFTGLIATLSYNVYAISAGTKRSVEADGYIIDFFEYVDLESFNNITQVDLVDHINDLDDDKISATSSDIDSLTTPYKVCIAVENYKPEGETLENLVKIVSYTIKYTVSNRENTIQINHIKTNEN